MQFMTTEHFTLQTARAVVNAEISARLQLYMTTLSSAIIALALVAQVSGALGRAFQAFALVLLPVVYFLGVVTLARLLQAAAEWRTYGQGMNRIRHWYLEVAPEMAPYFVLPATDDPWASLAAVGIRRRNSWRGMLATAPWMLVVVNSVLAGVVAGLLARLAGASGPLLPALAGAAGFVASLAVLGAFAQRVFRRDMDATPVAFTAPTGR
jgi:membrane-associated PAP2 superfamily phosphatase